MLALRRGAGSTPAPRPPSVCLTQSLEALLRGKELQLQQLADAWTGVRRQQRDVDERTSQILRERDDVIEQLQAALLARTQETQVI